MKAANEARDRAMAKFKLERNALPFFRTLHSLAFRQLAMSRENVFNFDHMKKFGRTMGLELSYKRKDEGGVFGMTPDEKLLHYEGLSRVRMISLEEQFRETRDIDWYSLDRIARGLAGYKRSEGLRDYHDMILGVLKPEVPMPVFDILVIDEAQDLSLSQWRFVERLIESSRKVYIAGDDDQAIFKWAGAEVDYFINIKGKVTVLDQSYRVPRAVQALADRTVNKIQNRKEKVWKPTDKEGFIHWCGHFEELCMDSSDWLVLARNSYVLQDMAEYLRREGLYFSMKEEPSIEPEILTAVRGYETLRQGKAIPKKIAKKVAALMTSDDKPFCRDITQLENIELVDFKEAYQPFMRNKYWYEGLLKLPLEQRHYIMAMLRRGEKISQTPRIKLSTIHGAKGGEATNVVLFSDIAPSTHEEYCVKPDDENRVLYVGQTRSKESLYVVSPQTSYYYDI